MARSVSLVRDHPNELCPVFFKCCVKSSQNNHTVLCPFRPVRARQVGVGHGQSGGGSFLRVWGFLSSTTKFALNLLPQPMIFLHDASSSPRTLDHTTTKQNNRLQGTRCCWAMLAPPTPPRYLHLEIRVGTLGLITDAEKTVKDSLISGGKTCVVIPKEEAPHGRAFIDDNDGLQKCVDKSGA